MMVSAVRVAPNTKDKETPIGNLQSGAYFFYEDKETRCLWIGMVCSQGIGVLLHSGITLGHGTRVEIIPVGTKLEITVGERQ